ncbi:MAG: hypothetical protein FWD06_08910 [Oscillospiraceae bacterium]|nr:hypothetical protein [Oscillospiraceae bacterium]
MKKRMFASITIILATVMAIALFVPAMVAPAAANAGISAAQARTCVNYTTFPQGTGSNITTINISSPHGFRLIYCCIDAVFNTKQITLLPGQGFTIIAQPAPAGQEFYHWRADLTGQPGGNFMSAQQRHYPMGWDFTYFGGASSIAFNAIYVPAATTTAPTTTTRPPTTTTRPPVTTQPSSPILLLVIAILALLGAIFLMLR